MPTAHNTKRVNTLVILDAQGLITGVDAGITDVLIYSADALIGQPIEALVTDIVGEQSESTSTSTHQRLCNAIGGELKVRVQRGNGESSTFAISVDEIVLRNESQLLLTLRIPPANFVKWIESEWHTAFNMADRAIAIGSADGKTIEIANKTFAAMYGYTREELVGKSFTDLCTPGTHDDFIAQTKLAINSGRRHFETTHVNQRGYSFPVAIDFSSINEEDGSVAYSIAYVHDISERKKLEQELHINKDFLQSIYDNAAIAMAICDLDGRYISVNSAMCEMVGYSETELLSMHFTDITHSDDIQKNLTYRQHSLKSNLKTYSQEKRYIHKNGKIIWAVLVVSLLTDSYGNTSFTIGQMIDLDKDPATGERLKLAYEHRENLVREVHHRIKNNLQSVTGLLRRQIYANPAASNSLNIAIGQVEAIALVHGLETNAGNPRLRVCDMLCGIIDERNKLQPDASHIEYPQLLQSPAFVRSEEAVPVALMLNELLTNAIKHHSPLRSFDIRITIARFDSDEVRISIKNPAEALPADFDFSAGTGMGQGLKLVRALMPKNNMQINYDFQNGDMSVMISLRPPIIYADIDTGSNESPDATVASEIQ